MVLIPAPRYARVVPCCPPHALCTVCHIASIAPPLCSPTGIVLIVMAVMLILVCCVLSIVLLMLRRRRRRRSAASATVLKPQPAKVTRTGSTPDLFQPTDKLHAILPTPAVAPPPPAVGVTSDGSSSRDTMPAAPVQPIATPRKPARALFLGAPLAVSPIAPRMDAFEHNANKPSGGHVDLTAPPAPQPWRDLSAMPAWNPSNMPAPPQGGPPLQAGRPVWLLPSDAALHTAAAPSPLPAGPTSWSAAQRGRYVMCW